PPRGGIWTGTPPTSATWNRPWRRPATGNARVCRPRRPAASTPIRWRTVPSPACPVSARGTTMTTTPPRALPLPVRPVRRPAARSPSIFPRTTRAGGNGDGLAVARPGTVSGRGRRRDLGVDQRGRVLGLRAAGGRHRRRVGSAGRPTPGTGERFAAGQVGRGAGGHRGDGDHRADRRCDHRSRGQEVHLGHRGKASRLDGRRGTAGRGDAAGRVARRDSG